MFVFVRPKGRTSTKASSMRLNHVPLMGLETTTFGEGPQNFLAESRFGRWDVRFVARQSKGASRIGGRRRARMARTWLILSALVAGLALGVGWTRLGLAGFLDAVTIADRIGGIWLAGLRMTIIPLVVSLLITELAKTVDSPRGTTGATT